MPFHDAKSHQSKKTHLYLKTLHPECNPITLRV